jgi:hypothetical protein
MKIVIISLSVLYCLLLFSSCSTGGGSHDPKLAVEPSTLDFRDTETIKTLNIVNHGGGSLIWEIVSDAEWIVCPVESGGTATSTIIEIHINGKEIEDPDQACEGSVNVISNGGNYTVSVSYIPGFTLTGIVYGGEAPDLYRLSNASVTLHCEGSQYSTYSAVDGSYILADVPKAFDYVEVHKEGYIASGIAEGTKLVIPGNNILEYDFFLAPDDD